MALGRGAGMQQAHAFLFSTCNLATRTVALCATFCRGRNGNNAMAEGDLIYITFCREWLDSAHQWCHWQISNVFGVPTLRSSLKTLILSSDQQCVAFRARCADEWRCRKCHVTPYVWCTRVSLLIWQGPLAGVGHSIAGHLRWRQCVLRQMSQPMVSQSAVSL